ncbi:LPS assembly lipoprotein LptE [Hahella sp. NBU794]|uniref:LPS-assembly lipoprotein LptE n=1 Tax=Hahella sp. NBU794 TaxID=3422590 RepID=UPI003D6E6A95
MRIAIRLLLAGMAGLLVSGCGFHLRGQMELPSSLQALNLSCPEGDARVLCGKVRESLQQASVQVSEGGADAPTLAIGSVENSRRAVSLDSSANAAEYELSRKVTFSLTDAQGEPLIQPTSLQQFQSYQYDKLSVLGKEKEENSIRDDLDKLLATEILNRLAVYSERASAPAAN